MKVTLLNCATGTVPKDTQSYDHEFLVQQAASICVGKINNPTEKGMEKALDSGHYSILEHLPITWLVEDVSRALTHQLVRHRIASYSQLSQRYSKVKTYKNSVNDPYDIGKWYVHPESIVTIGNNMMIDFHSKTKEEQDYIFENNPLFEYNELMSKIAEVYNKLIEAGVPNEDARMILPNACFTSIMVTMNARAFIEAATLRTCNKAQWEIQELFKKMRASIKEIYPHVYKLAYPNCTKKQGCLENIPCGNPYSKR